MEEEYKNCCETYEISNFGNMRRKLCTGEYKTINGSINSNRYKCLQIQRDNKRINYKFHCLVAKAFIGDRPAGLVIDHIDRNSLNNNVNNLRYITQKENVCNSDRYKSHIKEEGKERHLKVCKEYKENNKEQIRKHQKEYRTNCEVIICECGGKYKKYKKSDHFKTKKHLNHQ
jgi:hypothetical protein